MIVCARSGIHVSSGSPQMWTHVRWDLRSAKRRKERQVESKILSVMQIMELGVGQENRLISGVGSGWVFYGVVEVTGMGGGDDTHGVV